MSTDPALDSIQALFNSGNVQQGLSEIEKYLEHHPQAVQAWWLAAQHETSDTRRGRCLRRLLELDPEHTEAKTQLAQLEQFLDAPLTLLPPSQMNPTALDSQPEDQSQQDHVAYDDIEFIDDRPEQVGRLADDWPAPLDMEQGTFELKPTLPQRQGRSRQQKSRTRRNSSTTDYESPGAGKLAWTVILLQLLAIIGLGLFLFSTQNSNEATQAYLTQKLNQVTFDLIHSQDNIQAQAKEFEELMARIELLESKLEELISQAEQN